VFPPEEYRALMSPGLNNDARTSDELRALATWYREYAETAGNPMIWDYRLTTAEDLERQASDLEVREPVPHR
jgi:hypothetical protein